MTPATKPAWVKLGLLFLLTGLISWLVAHHVRGVNGPAYWRWPWKRTIHPAFVAYPMLFLCALPLVIAEMRFAQRSGRKAFLGLLLMMGTVFGFELVNRGLDLSPFDLTRVATIIEEPGTTGYFTHAEEFVQSGKSVRSFLHGYIAQMPSFTLHARNKPPGSILFYVPFLHFASTENGAAIAAGFAIALLATLSVPATYMLTMELTANPQAAFQSAALMSLCPGLVLFLPEFDQFYPVYSCLLIWLWARALKTGRSGYAVAVGLLFTFVCFQTFNLLTLGVFLAGYPVLLLLRRSLTPKLLFSQASVSIAAVLLFYGLLWLWSRYDPLRTLITGVSNHSQDMPATHRVWPNTIPFDLTDMALGMGWVCVLLAAYTLLSRRCSPLILLCFGQVIAVAIVGLLQGETARVWVFLFPLLLIPAGLELAQWRPALRLAALACLCLLAALLSQNMVFV